MKRIAAGLLALMICGGLLAGCGSKDAEEPASKPDENQQDVMPEVKPEEDKETSDKNDGADSSTMPSEGGASDAPSGTTESKPKPTTPPSSQPTGGSGSSSSGSGSSGAGNQAGGGSSGTQAPAPEPQPAPPEPAKPTASQAQGYVGQAASSLKAALGAPSSTSYSPSCMGEGEDGIWTYDGFTVYTYRENGTETVEAVQ
ncbi:hypothetical protein [Agathobaculum sp.]|uniref:hypothetical protein n=1 Tax=Agathobaculum sp. TaxID=2048138 RepID=UPI002A7FC8E3|nr:hypothetical protein [Agathobaculum sp.]MDY3619313.1 hypothetical protein [Agathobaculum sp.]